MKKRIAPSVGRVGHSMAEYKKVSRLNESKRPTVAGAEGLEPSTKVLETHVLPLHHAPSEHECKYNGFMGECQAKKHTELLAQGRQARYRPETNGTEGRKRIMA